MGSSIISSLLFEYDTVKFVNIKSRSVGLLSRLIQLVVIGYVIGYVIVWKKGYQEYSDIESAVTTKVKGVIYTNFSDSEFNEGIKKDIPLYNRIWDIEDLVIPPSENGAFFVTTNVEITADQTRGVCAEDPGVVDARCNMENNTCKAGHRFLLGNGVATGECVEYNGTHTNTTTCQIEAWCPVEKDRKPLKNGSALLNETKDFTVLIKNTIDFPKFKIRRRNIIDSINNKTYLQNCRYNRDTDQDCPVFVLGDIIHYVNEDEAEVGKPMDYDTLAFKGGVIAIIITWDCNLDFNKKYCLPKYSFRRLDDPEAKLSGGWNFRYAHYYNDNTRTLYKAYGIKFVVQVYGQGGKFSALPLFLGIGSGLALLAIQSYICDIVILYFLKNRDHYRNIKYEAITSEEDSIDFSVCLPGSKRSEMPHPSARKENYDRLED